MLIFLYLLLSESLYLKFNSIIFDFKENKNLFDVLTTQL